MLQTIDSNNPLSLSGKVWFIYAMQEIYNVYAIMFCVKGQSHRYALACLAGWRQRSLNAKICLLVIHGLRKQHAPYKPASTQIEFRYRRTCKGLLSL